MAYFIHVGRQRQKNYRAIELTPDQTVPELHMTSGPFQDAYTYSQYCIFQFENILMDTISLMDIIGIRSDNHFLKL